MRLLLYRAAILSISLGVLLGIASDSLAQDEGFSLNTSPLPEPTAYVNDYANVIDDDVEASVEEKIRAFREETGVEMAVAIVETTGDRPIFDYSLAVARGWGIGAKTDDNPGLLLFVAINDRKYFTQVSRDLEDELPDGLVGSLQRQFLVPEFKLGNYGKGVEDTIDAYIRTIRDRQSGVVVTETETPTPRERRSAARSGALCQTVICLIAIVVILILIFGSGAGGGGSSGGSGGGSDIASAVLWGILSGIASSSSSSSSGWGSGSSSWGGSSGGWGGFGGGGDFGGGGAGGGW